MVASVCIDCEDGPCKENGPIDCGDFNPTQILQLKENRDEFDEITICFECDKIKPCIISDHDSINATCKSKYKIAKYKKVVELELIKANYYSYDEIKCPLCSKPYLKRCHNFCPNCGVKIVWKSLD